jgi:cytosine/adenosine deaminase-related metal-dependent hydrolase
MTSGGSASVGRQTGSIAVGQPLDLIEIDPGSTRTAGSDPGQLMLTGTASDVATVVVAGRIVARGGQHATLGDTGSLLLRAIEDMA